MNIPWLKCSECPLPAHHGQGWDGNTVNPLIVFLGMSYGHEEVRNGKPFQGKAGSRLRKNIIANELDPLNDVAYFNVISCMPPNKRTEPTDEEIEFCKGNVISFLNETHPKVIVALGNTALKWLTKKSGIGDKRGKVYETPWGIVVPTYHPSNVDRNPDNERFLFEDIGIAKEIAINGLDSYMERSKSSIQTKMILSISEIEELADKLTKARDFSFDIETTGLQYWNELTGISFAMNDHEGYYIPFIDYKEDDKKRTPIYIFTDKERSQIAGIFQKVFITHKGWVYAHNAKFDYRKLYYDWKLPLWMKVFDTMIGHFLIDENQPHDLKSITDTLFQNMRGYNQHLENYKAKHRIGKSTMVGIPKEIMSFYGCCDAVACYRLAHWLNSNLSETAMKRYKEFYLPLISIYVKSELNGISVDWEYAEKLKKVYLNRAKNFKKKVYEYSKEEFNINSPDQLIKILYDKFKFPVLGFTKKVKKPSTGVEILIKLSSQLIGDERIGIIKYIVMYKKMMKFVSTYINSLYNCVGPDGRIHYNYNLILKTGRFSCSHYPIQTIPREDEVRALFKARDGWTLVHGDYSQLELREAATFSGSTEMLEAWKNGVDLHTEQAMDSFGLKSKEDVLPWQRYVGKTENFCLGEESFVLTNRGFVRPYNLIESDKIIDKDDNEQNFKLQVIENQPCARVLYSSGITESYSVLHPVLIWNGKNTEWKKIIDITDTDQVIQILDIQKNKQQNNSNFIDLNKLLNNRTFYKNKLNVNDKYFSYFIGYFLGNGSINSSSTSSTLNLIIRNEVISYFNYIINALSIENFSIKNDTKSDKIKVLSIFNTGLCNYILKTYYDSDGKKIVPDFIFNEWNLNNFSYFIAGLCDSDGSIDSYGKVKFDNTNKNIINNLALVCSAIGIKTTIDWHKPGITKNGERVYLNSKGCEFKLCYRLYFNFIPDNIEIPFQRVSHKNTKRDFLGWNIDKNTVSNIHTKLLDTIESNNPDAILFNNLKYGRCKLSKHKMPIFKKYVDVDLKENYMPVSIKNIEYYTSKIYAIETDNNEYISSCIVSHNSLIYGGQAEKVQTIINKGIFQAIILGKLPEETPLVDLEIVERGRKSYFKKHKHLTNFISKCRARIMKDGSISSIYGLTRHLPNALSKDDYLREEALRMGVNFFIQSPSSEICQTAYKKLGIKIYKQVVPVWLLDFSIHDSIFTEVKKEGDLPDKCAKYMKKVMLEPVPPNTAVLDVDMKISDRWAEIPQKILDEYETIKNNDLSDVEKEVEKIIEEDEENA